ncbi:Actin-like protein [Paramyrothecium foliicola]|nr:Actin-like protein [Paramyrothecium foliicola]
MQRNELANGGTSTTRSTMEETRRHAKHFNSWCLRSLHVMTSGNLNASRSRGRGGWRAFRVRTSFGLGPFGYLIEREAPREFGGRYRERVRTVIAFCGSRVKGQLSYAIAPDICHLEHHNPIRIPLGTAAHRYDWKLDGCNKLTRVSTDICDVSISGAGARNIAKMTELLHNAPIVLDNGSGTIRAGFAGDDLPKCFFPSWVGRPKHLRVLAGALEGDVFIGQKAATELRGLLKIHYPLEHGIVTDWDDMERIWEYVYGEGLKTLSEEHPVLLTEPPLNPRSNRETAAQILFETFNVPALHTSIQAVLSLYASGRTTGIVLDSGDGVSHAVPVYEGFAMPNSIQRIDVAGRDVTEYLQTLLRKSGYVFHTSAEKEVVRLIKESVSYIAPDPRKEERDWIGVKQNDNSKFAEYVLPDGHKLKIGAERFRAPEILFDPEIIGLEYPGVHQIVADAISRVDLDLRKSLYSNIVLSGGSTLTKGFGDRLLGELQKVAVKDMRIKIFAPPERKYSTWIGGSILAGLSTFRKMWVSIDDWHENPDIIHTKFT